MNKQIKITDTGINNKIHISNDLLIVSDHLLKIEIKGNNNVISIGNKLKLRNTLIFINGNDNTLTVKDYCSFSGSISLIHNSNNITIGNNCIFKKTEIRCEYGCNLTIGDSCVFEKNTYIRTGDSHSIISIETRKRLNNCESVFIGNHVLCFQNSSIFKGSYISNDSVIASNSLVNKKFTEANILLVGTPAKIKKQNINWLYKREF